MKEVRWSTSALDYLEAVLAYIAAGNPAAAYEVINKIEAAGQHLGDMATGRKGRVSGTYEKPVHGLAYIIAYAIEARRDGVEQIVILRVIHGARDWPAENWPED